MSSKLVRKLLQQTSELESFEKSAETKSGAKKRKREETTVHLDKKELLQRHIQSKIRLDRTIHARGKQVSKDSLERVRKDRKKQEKLRTKALQFDGGVVGNSRGSSYQKAHQRHEPTFNKKRHETEKKENMLKDIAKLLKKAKKPSTK